MSDPYVEWLDGAIKEYAVESRREHRSNRSVTSELSLSRVYVLQEARERYLNMHKPPVEIPDLVDGGFEMNGHYFPHSSNSCCRCGTRGLFAASRGCSSRVYNRDSMRGGEEERSGYGD